MEKDSGNEIVGDIRVADRDGVASHSEWVDNIGLAVAANLVFMAFHHDTEGPEAVFHVPTNEDATEEIEAGFNIADTADESGSGRVEICHINHPFYKVRGVRT